MSSKVSGMTGKQKQQTKSDQEKGQEYQKDLSQTMQEVPYLNEHLQKFVQEEQKSLPQYTEKLDHSHKKIEQPNIVYPIDDDVYVHIDGINKQGEAYPRYHVILPPEPDARLFDAVEKLFAKHAGYHKPPEKKEDKYKMIEDYLEKICNKTSEPASYENLDTKKTKGTVTVNEQDYKHLRYYFVRKRVGLDILQPFLTDPYLEDITMVGTGNIFVVHKIFGPARATLWIENEQIEETLMAMAEQFGKTISHAKPLIDASLPDGSRINIVFGKDVSTKGTNLTIRRFAGVPLSVTQLINFGTMDAREAAYLWMMLSQGMSLFVCGETASGKTTAMTALTCFIPPNWKVVSIEDTPELALPHRNWLSEVTRDTGNTHSTVGMQHLLKAALRQRPNYIIVGEIRGEEASIAFQAMQTGHPVISTFHAATVTSLIQRLTNEPIKVPKTNIDNLQLALMQGAVQGPDGRLIRRVLSINEIVGFDPSADNIMFIPLFNWQSATDTVNFKGKGSSSHFAQKLLQAKGLQKKDEGLLYEELETRTQVLNKMTQKKIFNYYEVFDNVAYAEKIGLDKYLEELEKR